MRPFRFTAAASEEQALRLGAGPGHPRYLAGGTGLLDLMKLHVEAPEQVVAVVGAVGDSVESREDAVWVGAAVSNTAMAEHPIIRSNFPVVSQAILAGASPQLRNMATLAGNLLQRTRCSYFRDVSIPACNKRRPGSGCAALDGFNRMHAVLGTSGACIAAHPSDLCVALVALEASIHVAGPGGKRWIRAGDFFLKPGNTPQLEHALAPGELVLGAAIPKVSWYRRSVYVKVRDRASYAFALASAAVALDQDESGLVRGARLALGGLGTVPWRAADAELALVGTPLSEKAVREAARLALADAQARRHNAYKVPLGEETLVRALREAGRIA